MEEKADLARLAFRVRALRRVLEEMDRMMNDVLAPGIHDASTALGKIEAELRAMGGVERIDVEAGMRAAEAFDGEVEGE